MSQLSIQDVNSAIMFGSFTNEQLESVAAAVKYRRSQIARENKMPSGTSETRQQVGRPRN